MTKATHEERAEAHRKLDQLEREAKAGAPDPWLAKEASCSIYCVRHWRKERGIVRSRGAGSKAEATRFALRLLGRSVKDFMMRTRSSTLKGVWEPPEYVLRGEVDYPEMARLLHYLHRKGGFPLNRIAEALGFTHRAVQQAIVVGDRIQGEDE